MQVIKAIIAFFAGVFAGMYGGQKNKAVRRFGLPVIATGFAMSIRFRWRYLAFLLFIPVLICGYGEKSILGAIVGYNEVLIRIIYAVFLSIPFYFLGLIRGCIASVALIIAFAIRAGSLWTFGTFDVLIEDICRYGTLMALVIVNVLTDKD
jgi:hypothetical protein